jgi:hypothetical protein
MRANRLLSGVTIIVVIFFGCRKDTDKAVPSTSSAYPFLKAGNEWTYDFYLNDTLVKNDSAKIRIVKDMGNGLLLTQSINYHKGAEEIDTGYFYNSAGGWGVRSTAGSTTTFYYHRSSWKENVFSMQEDSSYAKVVSVSKPVASPAGSFTCVQVENYSSGYMLRNIHYVDLKVGLILLQKGNTSKLLLRKKNF